MKNLIEVWVCLFVLFVVSMADAPQLDILIVWCTAVICLAIRRDRK